MILFYAFVFLIFEPYILLITGEDEKLNEEDNEIQWPNLLRGHYNERELTYASNELPKQKLKESKTTKNTSTSTIFFTNTTQPVTRSKNFTVSKYLHIEEPDVWRRNEESKSTKTINEPSNTKDKSDEDDSCCSNEKDLPDQLRPYTIMGMMKVLSAEFKDVNMTASVVGKTMERRDIVLITMSKIERETKTTVKYRAGKKDDKFSDDKAEKKVIFIVHGLSTVKQISFLKELKSFKKLLAKYVSHLDKYTIFLMPMANPDGAMFESNKNMSPQGACSGVALDRNFDIAWSSHKVGSSCSDDFPGPSPFSEPETRAIRDILHRYNHKIVAYIHVHSNSPVANLQIFKGDAILYPKGFSEVNSDDDRYVDLKGEVDEAIKNAHFQFLTVDVMSLYDWYGLVYGTSVDYAASVFGIPYSFEFAVQPMGTVDLQEIHFEFVWSRLIDIVFNYIHKNSEAVAD